MSAPLRIGIDIRPLAGESGRRGIGTYIRGLLAGMTQLEATGGAEVLLFGHGTKGPPGLPDSMRHIRLRRPRRGITFWDQLFWPPLLAGQRVKVFHSPFYAVPYFRPAGCGVVQTVHDLTPVKVRGAVTAHNERIFRANFRLARRADRIIVPSAATRDDVVDLLGIPARSVSVIAEACDITAADLEAADARRPQLLRRLGLDARRRYLLHTGGHDRVKNLSVLLEAFAVLVREGRDLDLVISGEHRSETGGLMVQTAMLGLLDRVRWPGFVPRMDLIALYRGAAALVYPSLAEGFGLPILEAMACGTPIVAADAGALPEVGGEACVLVPPADPEAIAAAIGGILDDPQRRALLSSAGKARAAQFSWMDTARRTMDVYREVAS